ncbi:MAG: acyltransferase family protein [Clostridia bacterium]|nr:acyltransferase family protein [Clostridia bacterium]
MAKKRVWVIDLIKALCIVLVILTHSANINPAMLDKTGLFYYFAVNKCVPAFLFISGFVSAMGSRRTLKSQYKISTLAPKLLRFLIPMLTAFSIFALLGIVSGTLKGAREAISRLLLFDFGPGSYYAAIMLQFVLLAPLMLRLVDKWNVKGVVIIGAVNVLYELLASFYGMDIAIYRIIMIRYFLVIALGMYFGLNRRKKPNWLCVAVLFVVGFLYIALTATDGYTYKIFTISPWNRSNFLAGLYVAAILYTVIRVFRKSGGNSFIGRAVSKVGQSTYHIMYTQMLYFVVRPAFDKLVFDMTTLPLWSQYAMDIVVSVLLGLVFCVADAKIFRKFYKTK